MTNRNLKMTFQISRDGYISNLDSSYIHLKDVVYYTQSNFWLNLEK